MSGRLVILPHKSWNVWNQDNREKVLRDERSQRETENKFREKERQHIQEKNYEQLAGSSSTTQKSTIADEPFRLFANLESREGVILAKGNPEYMKEKKEQELRKRKREGVEDWALGDGSLEKQGIKPWYERSSNSRQPPTDIARFRKDTIRKRNDDPVAHYMQQYVPDTYANESKELTDIIPPTSSSLESEINTTTMQQEDVYSSKKMKKEKKEKKHRSHHKEKRKHTDNERRSSSTANVLLGKFDVEGLQKSRLEREELERKRAVRLLAETDIYGSPGYLQPRSYSQQYNPNIARNNI